MIPGGMPCLPCAFNVSSLSSDLPPLFAAGQDKTDRDWIRAGDAQDLVWLHFALHKYYHQARSVTACPSTAMHHGSCGSSHYCIVASMLQLQLILLHDLVQGNKLHVAAVSCCAVSPQHGSETAIFPTYALGVQETRPGLAVLGSGQQGDGCRHKG